jgi:hypothetical protein
LDGKELEDLLVQGAADKHRGRSVNEPWKRSSPKREYTLLLVYSLYHVEDTRVRAIEMFIFDEFRWRSMSNQEREREREGTKKQCLTQMNAWREKE